MIAAVSKPPMGLSSFGHSCCPGSSAGTAFQPGHRKASYGILQHGVAPTASYSTAQAPVALHGLIRQHRSPTVSIFWLPCAPVGSGKTSGRSCTSPSPGTAPRSFLVLELLAAGERPRLLHPLTPAAGPAGFGAGRCCTGQPRAVSPAEQLGQLPPCSQPGTLGFHPTQECVW